MIASSAKRSQGFSLIELMVAMVLGLVLMGGVIQVFLTSKQSYSFNEELGWIQENSRFALEHITRDFRMAGYYGCSTDIPVVDVLNPIGGTGWQTAFSNGIFGFDGDDTVNLAFSSGEFPEPARPVLASGNIPRSDIVTLSRQDTIQSFPVTAHNAATAIITAVGHSFVLGDILVISDCDHSAVFQHSGATPDEIEHIVGSAIPPANCSGGLGSPRLCTAAGNAYTYGTDATVSKALSHAYYVDTGSNGLPALFIRELGNGATVTSSELVQGIENLQILYGVDVPSVPGDGFPNRYVTADVVDASTLWGWSDVVAIRIYLLSRSLIESASEPQTFSFMGTNYTPTDRFLRQEFVSTIQIRNRGS